MHPGGPLLSLFNVMLCFIEGELSIFNYIFQKYHCIETYLLNQLLQEVDR